MDLTDELRTLHLQKLSSLSSYPKCQTHPFEKRDKFVKQIGKQNINQNLQGLQNLTEIFKKCNSGPLAGL